MRIDISDSDNPMSFAILNEPTFTMMCYGTAVYVLDIVSQSIEQQCVLNQNTLFKPNQKVQVKVSVDELRDYLATGNTYTIGEATMIAQNILMIPGNDTGINLGATQTDEGIFYTIELPNIPMLFIPENFIKAVI